MLVVQWLGLWSYTPAIKVQILASIPNGLVAQLVEQMVEAHRVPCSIQGWSTININLKGAITFSFFVGEFMKSITSEMIKLYKLNKLGYDFMGYKFNSKNQLSYHHLIIPKRLNGPETVKNGAILTQSKLVSSHDYLHVIENVDPEIFYLISSEMLDENLKGKLDIENLKEIRKLLLYFEKEHKDDTTKKGKLLIKERFINNRIDL